MEYQEGITMEANIENMYKILPVPKALQTFQNKMFSNYPKLVLRTLLILSFASVQKIAWGAILQNKDELFLPTPIHQLQNKNQDYRQ